MSLQLHKIMKSHYASTSIARKDARIQNKAACCKRYHYKFICFFFVSNSFWSCFCKHKIVDRVLLGLFKITGNHVVQNTGSRRPVQKSMDKNQIVFGLKSEMYSKSNLCPMHWPSAMAQWPSLSRVWSIENDKTKTRYKIIHRMKWNRTATKNQPKIECRKRTCVYHALEAWLSHAPFGLLQCIIIQRSREQQTVELHTSYPNIKKEHTHTHTHDEKERVVLHNTQAAGPSPTPTNNKLK